MMTRNPRFRLVVAVAAIALVASACGPDSATTPESTNDDAVEAASAEVGTEDAATDDSDTANDGDVADGSDAETATASAEAWTSALMGAQWADNVTITVEGDTVTFVSDGLPSHEYLDVYLGDGADGKFIAGGVVAYDATHSFPLVPTASDTPTDTPNGTIGVSISGAVFFNPYEGDGSETVANDDNTTIDGIPFIDACGGHPLPNETTYHYHGIPFCVTDAVDTDGEHSQIIGYLFDGYPIYGPQDVDGEEPTDLDACMGHVGMTPDFDEPVYHYHVSSQANYISECYSGEAAVRARPGR